MTSLPALPPSAGLPATLASETAAARDYAAASRAEATLRAYASDWSDFAAWCAERNLDALPATPATVGVYLASLAEDGLKVSTIGRRLVALTQHHRDAGHHLDTRHPAVSATLRGIKRTHGSAQTGKAPVLPDDVRAMLGTLGDGLLGLRDRALLLVGFAGAFRRSELVALERADVEVQRNGLVVTIRRSKTDQEGAGRKVGIPLGSAPEVCPARSLEAWLAAAGVERGPLFRAVNRHSQVSGSALSAGAVALIVKRSALAAGLDAQRYAGHSLRAGLATSAAMAGADERSIMRQTGHRSAEMVRRYIRDGELFRDNAASKVAL